MKKFFQYKLIAWITSMVCGRVYAEWRALYNKLHLCVELAGLKTRIPLRHILPQQKEVAGFYEIENREGKETIGSCFTARKKEETTKYKRIPVVLGYMLVVSILAALPPQKAIAAITNPQAWTNIYHSSTKPGESAASFAVAAGTTRMLVVALTYSASSGNSTLTLPATSVTYGGVKMELAVSDASTGARPHTLLFYLKYTSSVMNGTTQSLNVYITSTFTFYMNDIYYAVYEGVS
jgi:hypothetical protein